MKKPPCAAKLRVGIIVNPNGYDPRSRESRVWRREELEELMISDDVVVPRWREDLRGDLPR